MVRLHDKSILALLARLNRFRGNHSGIHFLADSQHHVHELAGPELPLPVREGSFQLDGAGCAVDGIVDEAELAARRLAGIIGHVGFHDERPLSHGFANGGELIFGNRKRHVRRKNLVDRNHRRIGLRFDERTGLHLQTAGASIDGRGDPAIFQVQFCRFDCCFVGSRGGAGAFERSLIGVRGLIHGL